MNMKDFKFISAGVKNWSKTAHALREANRILNTPIEFLLQEEVSLDDSQTPVNVYIGYQDNALFAVLIQASKDLPERYRDDLDGVLQDMCVINATPLLSTSSAETNTRATVSGTQIEPVRAFKRMERWANADLRMNVMKAIHSAPLIFEMPKVNFEVQGQKTLLFGLKIAKKCCFYKKLEYDLLLRTETNTNARAVQEFYDRSKGIPPLKAEFSKGLYEYLGLSLSK